MKAILIVAATLALAACAQPPDQVPPADQAQAPAQAAPRADPSLANTRATAGATCLSTAISLTCQAH